MYFNFMRLSGILIFLCVLYGCSGNGTEDYFPLEEGRQWEYKLFVLDKQLNTIGEGKYIVKNLAAINLMNKRVTPQQIELIITNGKSKIYWEFYVKDVSGVLMIGNKFEQSLGINTFTPANITITPAKYGEKIVNGTYKTEIDCTAHTIVVQAGIFNNCYCFSFSDSSDKDVVYVIRNAAPGIGVVEFTIKNKDGTKLIGKLLSYKKL